ncbi:MAG: M43 family zinc metalloprotease [Flavipsychrobacter sp.]|nr:M43 family zinc metalloprotease [Flavipsychrobacter sp.]
MIRKITLLLLLCAGLHNTGIAQYSGFESAQQRLLTTDPAYAQRLHQMTTNWVNWNNTRPNISSLVVSGSNIPVFQIPVVVHVILPGNLAANPAGTTYDPTDAQINSMIAYLNQAFSATYVSYPDSNSGGTYIPIQFVLAKRDINCNSTTGIERINGSSVAGYVSGGVNNGSGTGAADATVKALSQWPVNQYYNIYIVNKIDGKDGTAPGVAFTTGFAYLPTAPSNVDGYTVLATQVASGSVNIVQEMGHALSLFNTFEGGTVTACPVNNNCATDGDQICDTPPELQSNFSCPSGINPCTNLPYSADLGGNNVQHNFMDYSSCQDRFTKGQRTRMIFGLFTYRSGLLGSQGAVAPGVGPTGASCIPSITNVGNTNDAGVTEFKISDPAYNSYIGNTTTYLDYTSGGYTTDGDLAYIDYTCRQQASLTAGSTYKFYVKTGATALGENVAVYIDYNNDGVFSATEQVVAHTGTTANEYDSALVSIPTTISNPSLVTCVPLRVRVISDPSPSINPCGPLAYGQAEDYSIVITGAGSSSGTVSITLPQEADTSCLGTALTFTAKPSAGVDTNTATYLWYVNGVSTGSTGTTYTTSNIADGSTVTVKLNFTNQCGAIASSTSNAIVVHRFSVLAPRVSIALTSGNNPGCPGFPMTFTATPFNGGATVAYQWKVNGVSTGGNTATFTTSTLNAGDTVSCVLYSSSSCAFPISAASNKIGILHYYLTASLTITATPNPSCTGTNVVLHASSLNQSASSQFQWYINSTPVAGQTGSTFVSNTFQNTDIVRCVMTNNSTCIVNQSDTSNPIVITVAPALVPIISDSIQSGANPGCLDSFITFSGYASQYGLVTYEWLVNGVPVFNGQTYSTDSLNNGDMVVLRASDTIGCYTQDTIYSLPITVTLSLTPDPPVVSLIGNDLHANAAGVYMWFGPNGLIPGVTGPTYAPTTRGFYYIERVDTACASAPSNSVWIEIGGGTGVSQYSIHNVKIYPNPSTGLVNIDWGTKNKLMKIVVYNIAGQGVLYNEVINQSSKTVDLGFLPSGSYFIVLRDAEGKATTANVTLANQ